MVTRRVKTGGAYVGSGGLGAPSPPQWQNTYEDQEFTGAYVADPGGGPDQWQYSGSAPALDFPALTSATYNLGTTTVTVQEISGVDTPSYEYLTSSVGPNPSLTWGYSLLAAEEGRSHFGFRSVSIKRNSYIESATLRIVFDGVGVDWPGAKIYAKKVGQSTIVAVGDSGYDWIAAGKLTTAYLQIPSHASMTTGAKSYDVTNILLELMAASDWVDTASFIQFVVVPDAACPTDTYTLSWDRTDGSGAGRTYLTFLDVSYYENSGNVETSAIRDGFVFNYMPVSDADLAIANRLRFVVQDNAGARESGVFVPSDSSDPSFFTGTVRNTTRKTVALTGPQGLVELPSESWTVLPQARMFGRKYTGHSDLSNPAGLVGPLGYTDGWRFLPEHYDYLVAVACEWEATDTLVWLWDVFNYSSYPTAQSFLDITANPTTGDVIFDVNAGTRVTRTVPSMSSGAGRTLRVMLFWDHLTTTWHWKIVVENSAGSVVASYTGSDVSATVWDAEGTSPAGQSKKWLVGFLIGSNARLYGQVSIEWQNSASAIWESTADWMTKSWIRGIKSLDPRLMSS